MGPGVWSTDTCLAPSFQSHGLIIMEDVPATILTVLVETQPDLSLLKWQSNYTGIGIHS
jgi:hypothetical protein